MWDSEKQNIFFKIILLNGHGSGSVLTNPSFHPLAHEHKIKIFMVVCHPPFCPPCHSLSLLYLFLFLYLVLHSLCPNLVSPIWSILSGLENLMLALPSDSQLPVLPQIGPLLNFNLVEANHDLALGAIFSSSPGFLPLPHLLQWNWPHWGFSADKWHFPLSPSQVLTFLMTCHFFCGTLM